MIEPLKLGIAAAKKKRENMKFRSFLKNRADKDMLDSQFRTLHNELFRDYDCCKCNNCCREYRTLITDAEAERMAVFLKLSKTEFIKEYVEETAQGFEMKAPCPLLQANGKCIVHECKPAECKDFPHTDKPERLFSLYGIISFAEVCPVVFEILERLKDIYGFKRLML